MANLQDRIARAESDYRASQAAAVKKLDADYQPLRAVVANVTPKKVFETTAQYQERQRKAKEDAAGVEERYRKDKADLEASYAKQSESATGADRERMAALANDTRFA